MVVDGSNGVDDFSPQRVAMLLLTGIFLVFSLLSFVFGVSASVAIGLVSLLLAVGTGSFTYLGYRKSDDASRVLKELKSAVAQLASEIRVHFTLVLMTLARETELYVDDVEDGSDPESSSGSGGEGDFEEIFKEHVRIAETLDDSDDEETRATDLGREDGIEPYSATSPEVIEENPTTSGIVVKSSRGSLTLREDQFRIMPFYIPYALANWLFDDVEEIETAGSSGSAEQPSEEQQKNITIELGEFLSRSQNGSVYLSAEGEELPNRDKVLLYLLGVRLAFDAGVSESHFVTIPDIYERTGVPMDDIRTYLWTDYSSWIKRRKPSTGQHRYSFKVRYEEAVRQIVEESVANR